MGLLDDAMEEDAVLVFCDPDTTAELVIFKPRGVTTVGEGTAVLSAGQLTSVTVDVAGFGYTYSPPVLVVTNGSRPPRVTATIASRVITGFAISDPGEGATSATVYVGGLYANVERDPPHDPTRSDVPRAKMYVWLPVTQVPSIDPGGDVVTVAYRRGGTTKEYLISGPIKSDAGLWKLALLG